MIAPQSLLEPTLPLFWQVMTWTSRPVKRSISALACEISRGSVTKISSPDRLR